MDYSLSFKSEAYRPTSGRAFLHSKLVDRRCQVQSPVALINLAVFAVFSETRLNTD